MYRFQFKIQIVVVLIYCLVPNQIAYSQQDIMVAYYGKSYLGRKLDSTKVSVRVMNMYRQTEDEISQIMPDVEYQLIFTNTESIFKVTDRLENATYDVLDIAISLADGKGIIYNNLQTKEQLHQKLYFDELLLIDISSENQEWNLVNETKKIGRFNCSKATKIRTTRNSAGTFKKPVVAWYTTDLLFPYGPIGYVGLPGLIVELTYEHCTYFLKSIDLKPKDTYKIEKPDKGKKVTLEEFYDIDSKAAQNGFY